MSTISVSSSREQRVTVRTLAARKRRGARIAMTALHGMEKRGGKLALATMCVGVGQGVAVAIEKLN